MIWNEEYLGDSSVWGGLVHLVHLTITYELVKLFPSALKKAAKIELKAGIWSVVFLESWRRGDCYGGSVDEFRLDYLVPSSGKL